MSENLVARVGKVEKPVRVVEVDDLGAVRVVVGETERVLDLRRVEGGPWSVIDPKTGRAWLVDLEPGKDGDLVATIGGIAAAIKLVDPRLEQLAAVAQRAKGPAGPEDVRAPMPGKVVKVLVKTGDKVAAGQPLLVIEAMKMENELRTPREGIVGAVKAVEGKPVELGETLLTLEPAS